MRYFYKIKLITTGAILFTASLQAQTKIGGTLGAGDPSSVLELQSTNQGLLLPRLTSTQRDAITTPATGLTIYNTTTGCEEIYQGSANGWHNMCNGGGTLSFTNCNTASPTGGTISALSPISGVTVTLNYVNNTNQTGGAFVSGTTNGITLSAPGGTVTPLTAGNGSITLTVSGTPTASGTTNVPIVLAGTACSVPFTVAPAVGNVPVACGSPTPCTGGISDPATAIAGSKICWGGYTYMVISFGTRLFLDRNLGATEVATGSRDAAAFGDNYQFGRRGDGHQCVNPLSPTTNALASGTIAPDNKFILNTSNPYHWTSSTQQLTLWDSTATGGINNPCPPGFRIPTVYEMQANGGMGVDIYNTTLKMPFTPDRTINNVYMGDTGGRLHLLSKTGYGNAGSPYSPLWSYSPATTGALTGTTSFDNGYFASGYGVRCIKH